MGGLRRYLPQTFGLYLLPMLALAGLPLTSGFLSKDGILVAAWAWAEARGGWAWLLPINGLLVAGLTAFYMARHAWLIWGGTPRAAYAEAPQESDAYLRLPLLVLALGSLWLGFSWVPWEASHSWLVEAWRAFPVVESSLAHQVVPVLSVVLALGGLGLGSWRYRRWREAQPPSWLTQHFYQDRWLHRLVADPGLWLSQALSWWDRRVVDGLVNLIGGVVHDRRDWPLPGLSRLAAAFDDRIVDGLVNGLAAGVSLTGRVLRKVQSGRLQQYLALALLGVLLMIGAWLSG